MSELIAQQLCQPLRKAGRDYGPAALTAAVAAMLICHALFLRDGFTSPDGLNEGLHFFWNSGVLLSVGRWMAPFAVLVTRQVVMPAVHLVFNALCVAAATLMLSVLWRLRGRGWVALCAVSLAVAPATVGQCMQIHTAYFYGLAMLLFVLSAYLVLQAPGVCGVAGGAVALAMAMGCYQAYLGFSVATILFALLLQCLAQTSLVELGQQTLRALVMGLAGIVLYFLMFRLTLLLFGQELSNRMKETQFGLGTFLANLVPGVINAYKDLARYCLARQAGVRLPFALLMLLVVGGCLIGFVRLLRTNRPHAAVLVVLGLLTPIALNAAGVALGMGTNVPMSYPMQLVLPFGIAVVQSLTVEKPVQAVRGAAALLIAAVCWLDVVMAYSTYYTVSYTYHYVNDVTQTLLCRVYDSGLYTPGESRLLIAGLPDENLPQVPNKVYYLYKDSLFEPPFVFWPNWTGVVWGWSNYLYAYHGLDTGLIFQEEYEEVLDSAQYAAMPVYPQEGCVAAFGDLVVVKYRQDPPR